MLDDLKDGEAKKIVLSSSTGEARQYFKDTISKSIIGQGKAKEVISDALFTNLTSLIPKKGTLGTFLFCGPSGVGKTETVRAIADVLLGNPDRFTRINCENLTEAHTISSLTGSPPGYVGYGKDTMLGEHVYKGWKDAHNSGEVSALIRRFPLFSIILFDEIEKAHPKIHQSLLGLMDSGDFKMADGSTLDLGNSLVFMTSNVGEREMRDIDSKKTMGFIAQDNKSDKDKAFKESLKLFSPEFMGRIDSVVRFEQLTEEDCKGIIDIKLGKLNDFLDGISSANGSTKLQLKLTPGVYKHLLSKGFNKSVGARDIERVFQREINSKLGEILSSNTDLIDFPKYRVTIYAEMFNGDIRFTISKKNIENVIDDTVLRIGHFIH